MLKSGWKDINSRFKLYIYLNLLPEAKASFLLQHIEKDNEWERTRNGCGMQATQQPRHIAG